MKIPVTYANTFRGYFPFVRDKDSKKNISHHMQYIEFLYKIKEKVNPQLTTESLLIKTIIIEYFVIVEAVIDDLLCQLEVKIGKDKFAAIEVDEYQNAEGLFKLAKKYKIINSDIHSKIGQLKNTRNKIHIKRPRRNQKYECECYTQNDLDKYQKIYKDFLNFLLVKYQVAKNDYPWPWEQRK
jgi:hypothetical protein